MASGSYRSVATAVLEKEEFGEDVEAAAETLDVVPGIPGWL